MLSLTLALISFASISPQNSPQYANTIDVLYQTSFQDTIHNTDDDWLIYKYDLDLSCYINYSSSSDYEFKIYSINTTLYVYDLNGQNLLDTYEISRNVNYTIGSTSDVTIYAQYNNNYDEVSVCFDYTSSYNEIALFETPIGYYSPLTIYRSATNDLSFYLAFNQYAPMLIEHAYALEGATYDLGYNDGYEDGYDVGNQLGFNEGIEYAQSGGSEPSVIFTGILNVALLPVNMFLQILNFEVFGINIGALVTGLLTIAVVIIIVRLVTGKKND